MLFSDPYVTIVVAKEDQLNGEVGMDDEEDDEDSGGHGRGNSPQTHDRRPGRKKQPERISVFEGLPDVSGAGEQHPSCFHGFTNPWRCLESGDADEETINTRASKKKRTRAPRPRPMKELMGVDSDEKVCALKADIRGFLWDRHKVVLTGRWTSLSEKRRKGIKRAIQTKF